MSTPPGMIVNAQGITGEGVEFSLINKTDKGIVVTLFLVVLSAGTAHTATAL